MGLFVLEEFRKSVSDMMLCAMHKRVVLYGFGYTGRFLKWYAEYYHGIQVDYIVSLDMPYSMGYEQEIFMPSIFEYDYKDIKDCVVWLATPLTDGLKAFIEKCGYIKGKTYFDFYGEIYGKDIVGEETEDLPYQKKKSGQRDIQFLEWLEWKYDCNFVTAVDKDKMYENPNGTPYRVTTQKEIFEILDACHCKLENEDAILDVGCGKGGAIVSFLDYGFKRADGVEFDNGLSDVCRMNINNLNLTSSTKVYSTDASTMTKELDEYNWFYFFQPFSKEVYAKVIKNIEDSIKRKSRKVRIIYVNCNVEEITAKNGVFKLVKSFTVPMRNRVIGFFEN